jgi:hypothetical protein
MNIALVVIFTILVTAAFAWLLPKLHFLTRGRFKGLDPYHFETRVELLGKSVDGVDIDVFSVAMRGHIITPCDNCISNVEVKLYDITDSTSAPLPILCMDPQFQKSGTPTFHFQTYNGVIPGRDVILPQWRTILDLGCDVLRFPRRGQRTLQVITHIMQKDTNKELVSAKAEFSYFVAASEGYLDFQSRLEKMLAAGYILGNQTAGDQPLETQTQMLESWLNECLHTSAVNLTIDVSRIISAETPEAAAQKACDILLRQSEVAFRQGLFELFIKIAAIAQPVSREKQDWLSKLAERLEIPADRFRAMYQKYMPLEAQTNPDPATMLGIDPNLSAEDLQKRLTEEYRKWNARVNHPDAEIRKRADQMLSYLTELRSRMMAQTKA